MSCLLHSLQQVPRCWMKNGICVIQVVLQRARPDGSKMRQVRIAECIVGDETGVIVFTARTLPNCDQGKSADSRFAQNASIDFTLAGRSSAGRFANVICESAVGSLCLFNTVAENVGVCNDWLYRCKTIAYLHTLLSYRILNFFWDFDKDSCFILGFLSSYCPSGRRLLPLNFSFLQRDTKGLKEIVEIRIRSSNLPAMKQWPLLWNLLF